MKKFLSIFVTVLCLASCKQITEENYYDIVAVSFDANGGSGVMPDQRVAAGKKQNLNKNAFTAPNGKIFAGWSYSAEGEIEFSDCQQFEFSNNELLYAQWKILEGTGTGIVDPESYKFGKFFEGTESTTITPGNDFYNYIGNYALTSDDFASTFEVAEDTIKNYLYEEYTNPTSNLIKISKSLLEKLNSEKIEEKENEELAKLKEINSRESLFKYIADNMFDPFSMVYLYQGYYGCKQVFQICYRNQFVYTLDDLVNGEKISSEDAKAASTYFKTLDNLPSKPVNESSAYELLKDYIAENYPMLASNFTENVCYYLDYISEDSTDEDSDDENVLSVSGTVNFLKVGILMKYYLFSNILSTDESISKNALCTLYLKYPYSYALLKSLQMKLDSEGKIKSAVKDLATNIVSTFKGRLERNTWMSDTTRKAAIEKASECDFMIGYPDDFSKYPLFDSISESDYSDYFDFFGKISREYFEKSISLVGGTEIGKAEKNFMCDIFDGNQNLSVVNCFHTFPINSMTILFPFILSPMFDITKSDAINYGMIGTVIGHELCHGFDSEGSKYDKDGNKKDWWTISDKLIYKEKQNEFITLFNNYQTNSGFIVNGEQTITENMADHGGIVTSFEAFVNKSATALTATEFRKQAELFFKAYTILWLSTRSDFVLEEDVHSPNEIRVNGIINNLDEWYDLYGAKKGDKYYLTPSQRLVLW